MKYEANYGHYHELLDAGSAYLEGKMSRGVFEETINRIHAFVRDGMKQFQSIELPPELKKEFQKDIEKAEKGFNLFEEGVKKMKRSVDEENKKEEILWQGLGLAKFGCDLLNEVMHHQEKYLGDGEKS